MPNSIKLECNQTIKKSSLKEFLEIPGIVYIFPIIYHLIFPCFYFLTYKLGDFESYNELNTYYLAWYLGILILCYFYALIRYKNVQKFTEEKIVGFLYVLALICSKLLESVSIAFDFVISKISKDEIKDFFYSIVKSIFSDWIVKTLGDLLQSINKKK